MAKTKGTTSTRTKNEAKYLLWKYIEIEEVEIHPYTRAYVVEQYRGILKTKDEWAKTLKPILEGNK